MFLVNCFGQKAATIAANTDAVTVAMKRHFQKAANVATNSDAVTLDTKTPFNWVEESSFDEARERAMKLARLLTK